MLHGNCAQNQLPCIINGWESRFGPSDPNRDLDFGSRILLKNYTWEWRMEGSKQSQQKLFYCCFCFSILEQSYVNVFALSSASHTGRVEGRLATNHRICKGKVCSKSCPSLSSKGRQEEALQKLCPGVCPEVRGMQGHLQGLMLKHLLMGEQHALLNSKWSLPQESCVLGLDHRLLN